MKIHFLQQVPFEGPGSIAAWAENAEHRISSTRLFQSDPLPKQADIDWLIIMGGPMSIHDEEHYPWLIEEKRFSKQSIEESKIVLGICLGAQLIADVLGAKVYPNDQKEIGCFPVKKYPDANKTTICGALPDEMEAFHWHGDTFGIPVGAVRLASSNACPNQGFVYKNRVIGLQFHLETTRESVENLVENCSTELATAPYIQTAATMLKNNAKFERINLVMNSVLERMAQHCFDQSS